jgi:hypothetical protein
MMSEEINPSLLLYLLPDQPESQPIAVAVGAALDAIGTAQAIGRIRPTPSPHAPGARSRLQDAQDTGKAFAVYIHEPVVDKDRIS